MRPGQWLAAAAGALVLAVWPRALYAHDFWIEATPARPEVGGRVAVRLRVGEHLRGEPLTRSAARIERFVAVGPAGERAIPGIEGADPAGHLLVAEPGLHLLGYRSRRSHVVLPPDTFEAYLAEEGLDHVRAARAARGTSGTPGREVFSRCAKALVPVVATPGEARTGPVLPERADVAADGAGSSIHAAAPASSPAPSPGGHDRVLGLTLELVPEADPHALAPGAELPLRLLYEGRPLAGALVVAMRRGDPAARVSARTGAAGRVALALAAPDFWLVKAVHMVPAPAGVDAEWESLWASLTFDTRAPPD
jgi:hypothetical protein